MAVDNSTLAHKVARGAFWVATSFAFSQVLYFVRTVILVRLLNPIDFGLMGIARVVINMLNLFSETGIDRALVQKKEVSEVTLNSAWIITVLRGILLFVVLFLFSPLISSFYKNEHLNPILKFISLSFLFSGITSAGIFLFIKEINFKNKVLFEQANAVSNTIISIVLAIIFKNVWALVIGYVVGIIIGFLFSYKLHPFRPSLQFDLNSVKELFKFGKYVFASAILVFLTIQGPDALVGKVLGLSQLGFYVLAFSIANTPTTSITHVVSQIAFPAYAKLQDELPKLRDGYLKIIRLVTFLSAPIAGGIFMLIPEFVQIFLGTRWMPIVLPVRILCILGFFRSIASTASPVFLGIGRPDIEFKFACFNFAVLAILIYPLTIKFGIVGTSVAFSLLSAISVILVISVNYKLIHLGIEKTEFLKVLFFPLIGTILMCFLILSLKTIFHYSLIATFLTSVLIGGGCYILLLYILDRYFKYGLVNTIQFAINSFKISR